MQKLLKRWKEAFKMNTTLIILIAALIAFILPPTAPGLERI